MESSPVTAGYWISNRMSLRQLLKERALRMVLQPHYKDSLSCGWIRKGKGSLLKAVT
jgi:hypothetical protein